MTPDTPLRNLPLAVVDFEATGFPGEDAHIVEVAVVHIELTRHVGRDGVLEPRDLSGVAHTCPEPP